MEQLTSKLENIKLKLESSGPQGRTVAKDLQSQMKDIKRGKLDGLLNLVHDLERREKVGKENTPESLSEFDTILAGPLTRFKLISSKIGGEVSVQVGLVVAAFEAQREFLKTAAVSKKPNSKDIESLLKPTAELIGDIQEYRESNRRSTMFNHLSALSESIPALGWVGVASTPAPFVKEMKDAGMFYTNRVLKDWKEKDGSHVDWVKSWTDTLTELQNFVKKNHTTGLVWNPKGEEASLSVQKKVTLKPAPASKPAPDIKISSTKAVKVFGSVGNTQPSLRQDGKKWTVEYFKGDSNIKIDDAKMNQSVYIYKCEKSTIKIREGFI